MQKNVGPLFSRERFKLSDKYMVFILAYRHAHYPNFLRCSSTQARNRRMWELGQHPVQTQPKQADRKALQWKAKYFCLPWRCASDFSKRCQTGFVCQLLVSGICIIWIRYGFIKISHLNFASRKLKFSKNIQEIRANRWNDFDMVKNDTRRGHKKRQLAELVLALDLTLVLCNCLFSDTRLFAFFTKLEATTRTQTQILTTRVILVTTEIKCQAAS